MMNFAKIWRMLACASLTYVFSVTGTGAQMEPDIHVTRAGRPYQAPGPAIPNGGTADFGPISIGFGRASSTFWINNTGTTNLVVTLPISITGPHASDFGLSLSSGSSGTEAGAAPGSYIVFEIWFDPTAAGLRTATVTIGSNDPDENPYTFTIQGTGESSGVEIDVSGNDVPIADGDTTPSAMDGTDFGSAAAGGGEVSRTFTIRNTGTVQATGGGPSIGGPHAADFTIVKWPTSPAAGELTTFVVRFAPIAGATGLRTAEVSIGYNDDDEYPYNFAIQGTATAGGAPAPEITVRGIASIASGDTTPSASDGTDYGEVAVGSYKLPGFTIENIGSAPLDLGGITLSGSSAFTLEHTPPSPIAARGTGTLLIGFSPTGTGTVTATVTIPSNDSDENPYTFTLSGTGVTTTPPPISVTGRGQPITHASTTTSASNGTDFGSAAIDGGGVTEAYTLTNTGTAPLGIIPDVVVTGPDASDFRVTVQPSFSSLAPGASTTFQVNFQPRAFGERTAIVMIRVDDPEPRYFTYEIGGTGVAGELPSTGRPIVTQQPVSRAAAMGEAVTFTAATSAASPTYQWSHNGALLGGATASSYTISPVEPARAGIYAATITESGQSTLTAPAILGVNSTVKVLGAGREVGANIVHPNGNVYDQILTEGSAATVTADPGQVVRISFVDLSDNIVQVEFSGAGALSLVLDAVSGPATAKNYNQPDVQYMRGHAGIVISGANETTHVSVFSVGRANAVNQSLFRDDVTYDGVADVAFLTILSANGKFGGLRAANASFWATRGLTGIYAPNVEFTGPVYLCDITAIEQAQPVLLLGSAGDVRVTGGDLAQTNNRAVQVSGFTMLRMANGTTSHGATLPATPIAGRLEENGADVTGRAVVQP